MLAAGMSSVSPEEASHAWRLSATGIFDGYAWSDVLLAVAAMLQSVRRIEAEVRPFLLRPPLTLNLRCSATIQRHYSRGAANVTGCQTCAADRCEAQNVS